MPVVKEDLGFNGSREHLRKILLSLGFKYKKCHLEKTTLMERLSIAAKRETYLETIMTNRFLPKELRRDVIYIGESYIHQSYNLKKCWQSVNISGVNESVSEGKRYIIMLAGGENGFVSNALSIFNGTNKNEGNTVMNKKNFTKWVEEKLIPNLPNASIVVLDDAPYSLVLNKTPSSSSKISDIKMWLSQNNIPYDDKLRKPQLLMLVKRYKPEPIYQIDAILGEHGHTVVRLPPYHCDLNPIELIWGIAKRKIASLNVGSIEIKVSIKKQAAKPVQFIYFN